MKNESKARKKMGGPKKYEGDGAPYLGLRLEPPIYEHIRKQPEGSRAYVERLVTEDMEKSGDLGRAPEAIKASDALD